MTSEKKDITKPTMGDVVYANTKGALASIPVWGSLLSENFALLVVPPATKRRDEFLFSVEKDLRAIEAKVEGFNIEALFQNELFITTLLQAIQIAIRSHQQEKLEALRNAVMNTALATEPKEDMQLMFLNWIDTLTSWHIRILRLLHSKEFQEYQQSQLNSGSRANNLFELIKRYNEQYINDNTNASHYFFEQVYQDLLNKKLINNQFQGGGFSSGLPFSPQITEMGQFFFAFIESPLQDKP